MKHLLLIFCSLLQSICSTIPIEPKLCINCKFFVKRNFFTPDELCKCSKFSYTEVDNFFINGVKQPEKKQYYYCSTARNYDHMCGNEGKKFEKK